MMKTFLKRIIFKFFGAKIYYCVEALYTSKFKFKSLKYVKIKVDNLKHNENTLNKLNINSKKINYIFKKNNYIYVDQHLSWHYHIFAGLSNSGSYNILEIGTYIGKFTNYLSNLFPNSKIITIDLPDEESKDFGKYFISDVEKRKIFFDERKKNLNNKNIEFLQFNSSLLTKKFNKENFDLIWVDGNHLDPQVSNDIDQSIYLCKKKGIICVDDVIFENYKDEYTSNDSFITLEDKKKKNILDTNYFLKRIYNDHKANIIYKYISYSIKN